MSVQISQTLHYSVCNTQLSLSSFKSKLQNCIAGWKSWTSDDQNISTIILALEISGYLPTDDTFLTIFSYSQGPELIHEKAAAFENYTKCFCIWNVLWDSRAITGRGETNFSTQSVLEGVWICDVFTALHWLLLNTVGFYSWSGEASSESMSFKRRIEI